METVDGDCHKIGTERWKRKKFANGEVYFPRVVQTTLTALGDNKEM